MTKINWADIEPVNVTASSALVGDSAAADDLELVNPYDPAESRAAATSKAGEGEKRPPQRKLRQKQKRYTCPLDDPRNWLTGDPAKWVGRKVVKRMTGAIYTVRQIFKSGRVQLEKNWMTYLTDVATVRKEYESLG